MSSVEGVSYALNGYPLESDNCTVLDGSTLTPSISVSRSTTEVAGRVGTVTPRRTPVFKERQLTVTFGIGGSAWVADTMRIASLCTQPNLTLTRTVGQIQQTCRVELESLTQNKAIIGKYAQYTAAFAMPDVYFAWADYVYKDVSVGDDVALVPSYDHPDMTYWTDYSPDGDGTSVLYIGTPTYGLGANAPLNDLIIRVPAKCTSLSITDATSQTGILWDGTVSSGYLYVNCQQLTSWQSTSATAWDGTGSLGSIDYPPAGPLTVWPTASAAYHLNVAMTGGASNARIRFTPHWW